MIFHSYVSLPEGNYDAIAYQSYHSTVMFPFVDRL